MIECIFENGKKANLRHVTVGALVINSKDEVLLVKRAEDIIRGGKYTVPGGFIDRDETAYEAVIRELKEEAGVSGEVIKLLRINDNPERPKEDRQNVDFIFLVHAISDSNNHDSEVTEVKWFNKDNLPDEDSFAFDHREIILEYFRKKDNIPLLNNG